MTTTTKATETKIFKMMCIDFGHKFSFNAKNQEEANDKVYGYSNYHSMFGQFYAEETTESKWMHNEYVN